MQYCNESIDLTTFVKRLHRIATEREKERCMLAANRNMLQQQRANLKMVWKGYLYQHANTTWSKFRTLIIKLKAAKRCFQVSKVNTTRKLCII